LRLIEGVPLEDFSARTGLPAHNIAGRLAAGRQKGWLENHPQRLKTTPLGQRFLNDVIASFLD
jgi:oxygen-independent coproporphyrinogen-3 oxidase